MRDFSYQLHSSRKFGPLPDTLRMLAGLGYRQVEGDPALFAGLEDPGQLRDALAAAGLTMPTAHVSLEMVSARPDRVIEIARALDMEAVFVPALPEDEQEKTAEGWAELGRVLALSGARLREAGVAFGWHNHAFEFAETDSAETPLDLILAGSDDLALELDIAWVARAGQDPVHWLRKYADRIVAVHVKDIAPEGENAGEDGWADVGDGILDWRRILPEVEAAGARFLVMEHDNPADDARFARRSIAAASGF
ncbi:sugar phosphate isomerase/epimerase family protein [Tropicimonas sediminicola]|uniref:Sugar phosphate isomerase/epimerase n=1 Tax=Tropicimonas sediminicola TaxID=1031541 RepID=A0A239CEF3_9RHOB|nr:sugar phosphate isomerase/epimerase [Tropicimonas sediminicola]SNS18339.1 Sugar phosphate isomerase/epimerase [Tropicimonas sediminicola]